MDIEQAENQFKKIIGEVKNKKLNTVEADKFFIEFIELMETSKLSNGNINLFASLVASFLFSKPKFETIKKILPITEIYLRIMDKSINSSVYDERGILVF